MIDAKAETWTLSTNRPNRRAELFASGMIVLSFLTCAAVGPIARTPLARLDAFIPAYEAALAICDLLTAALLFAEFLREKTAAILVIASSYLFNLFLIVPHALTFPGVFAPHGLLGAGSQTTAWLYLFWHGGFAAGVLAYAIISRIERINRRFRSNALPIVASLFVTGTLATALVIIATRWEHYLPALMEGSYYSMAVTKSISPAIVVVSIFAIVLCYRARHRSVLDLWLLVVMSAWLCDVALGAVLGSSRFDLGWYVGRSFSMLAASFLLITLLIELNIIQSRMMRAELYRTTALFEAVINMTPDLVFVKDLESRALLRNPAARFGKSWKEIEGRKEAEWHSQSGESLQVVENDRLVIASGKSMQFVEHFTTEQGRRILLSTKSPLFDEEGEIVGTIGVSTDITERESRARHLEFVMHELSHRSKNLLTVILAIARQSVRQSADLEDFGARFSERISALARLHDLLVQEEWHGAPLHAVAHSQIAPFAGNRFKLEGPNESVRPDVAQVISMVFHELATNASKYGALSGNEGYVAVTWGFVTDGRDRFFIQWQERNGPTVLPPLRKGFGTTVVERMALQIPDSVASLKYFAAGVIWYLEAPYHSFVVSESYPLSSEA
jgi:PAS domain S-box-containing protein